MALSKRGMLLRRKLRIRKKVNGTTERPRLTVFRSGKHIYAQVIDDVKGHTLVAASTLDKDIGKGHCNKDFSAQVGKLIAKRAIEVKIDAVVFDRNGYRFHGCIKSLADSAREEGLRF